MQNKLTLTTIITLYFDVPPVCGPYGTQIKLKASGTCMVFHPHNKEVFQVETEEGLIFKCSTAYSSKYLMIYQAHYLSVHRMDSIPINITRIYFYHAVEIDVLRFGKICEPILCSFLILERVLVMLNGLHIHVQFLLLSQQKEKFSSSI
jgi:hypothetical protein